jgi:uncharacterized protein YbgA (DUF1722 family)/uncharacterized protein YbbK (DUF523 family)
MKNVSLRVGISRCLLGDEVRFDGGHKRDGFLTDVLGRYVEWISVCPEVEAGLGTPREAMKLVGDASRPRLITIKSGADRTSALGSMIETRIKGLRELNLSGYVFKKDSPSCGLERVRLYNDDGIPSRNGVGVFAAAFREAFPLVPVEEEGRLCDSRVRENFIERIFCYRRYQDMTSGRITLQAVLRFHTIHKYLLLAHSHSHYHVLGRLLGRAARFEPKELAARYGEQFMGALTVKTTVRKHVNVLQHIVGYFTAQLNLRETSELLRTISDFHQGLTPLVVPLTLIKHYVERFNVGDMRDQVYLNPHPKELMLRNHL